MKECKKCGVLLTKLNSYKKHNDCKKCKSKYEKERRRRPEYFVKTLYLNQCRSVKSILRNATKVEYNEEELYSFCIENGLLAMLTDWKSNGYETKHSPSIDRINSKLNYTLDNIQLITWEENRLKGDLEREKRTVCFDKHGNKYSFNSRAKASKELGVSITSIYDSIAQEKYVKGYLFT